MTKWAPPAVRFGITTIGSPEFLTELDSAEYKRISQAAALIWFALGVEEKFDILLQNYADIGQGLRDMRRLLKDDHLGLEKRIDSERRLSNKLTVNLLNTARMYCDHLKSSMSGVYDKGSPRFAAIAQLCAKERAGDGARAFRIVDALRNYAQHRELPVEAMLYGVGRGEAGRAEPRHRVSFAADAAQISQDRRFKKDVVPELIESADRHGRVDLPRLIRAYVTTLARIHMGVRAIVADDLVQGEQIAREVRKSAEARVGTSEIPLGPFTLNRLAGLAVVKTTPSRTDRRWISLRSIERRLELIAKHPDLGSVSQIYGLARGEDLFV